MAPSMPKPEKATSTTPEAGSAFRSLSVMLTCTQILQVYGSGSRVGGQNTPEEGSAFWSLSVMLTVVLASNPAEGSSMATATVPSAPAVISKKADLVCGVQKCAVVPRRART